MIDRQQFEDCYCPPGKDSTLPQNWIRKKYVLDYPDNVTPPYPSDADTQMIIHKSILVDSNLDNYTIGIYLRLLLLTEYHHYWKEIYNYGDKKFVDKALQILQDQHYIKILDDNTMRIYY